MDASVRCLVDAEPYYDVELPANVVFVGMEQEPNEPPRYGKLFHPWRNMPCYETREKAEK